MPNSDLRLDDRGVVHVAGPDAATFLQGLLTNDVESLVAGASRYAALLSPQGKILFDMIVFRTGAEEFLIDAPANRVADLIKRLGLYKLRADVAIGDRSDQFAVVVGPEGAPPDPRSGGLGRRALAEASAAPETNAGARADYDARRIALGVPEGGKDFSYGEAFPHDVNMDLLNGVDFAKGCFVGQEVVSRMKHRGDIRRRIVRVEVDGIAPAPGTVVVDGDLPVGTMGSALDGRGLALLRLDRAEAAALAGRSLISGSARIAPIADKGGA